MDGMMMRKLIVCSMNEMISTFTVAHSACVVISSIYILLVKRKLYALKCLADREVRDERS